MAHRFVLGVLERAGPHLLRLAGYARLVNQRDEPAGWLARHTWDS